MHIKIRTKILELPSSCGNKKKISNKNLIIVFKDIIQVTKYNFTNIFFIYFPIFFAELKTKKLQRTKIKN